MKILFPALRVSSLDTSLEFYTSVGLEVVGQVTSHTGTRMAMLAWPWDDDVSLELVSSADAGTVVPDGFDHLAIQVDDLEATRRDLVGAGLDVGAIETHGGDDGPRTVTVEDPDGHHLELVQWPAGHPVGMTRGDFDPVTPVRAEAPSATRTKETQR